MNETIDQRHRDPCGIWLLSQLFGYFVLRYSLHYCLVVMTYGGSICMVLEMGFTSYS